MQNLAVTALAPGTPASSGQVAGGASDAVALEDVGFAALLAAQIQGDIGVSLIPAATGAVVETLPLVDDKQKDLQSKAAVDATLAGMVLVPVVLPPVGATQQTSASQTSAEPGVTDAAIASEMQQIPVKTKEELALLSSPLSAKLPLEGKVIKSPTPAIADTGLDPAAIPPSLQNQGKMAEFAVSGKVLPLNSGGDMQSNESRALAPVAAESQNRPESVPDVSSAVITTSQMAPVVDMKTAAATVQPLIGSPGWGDALGQKVVWMAGQQQQVAELHLNPPHLGPMEVRLTINNDQVTALFVSHQPAVREAIEAAMPRLREMFADNGMMLGNAMVSSDSLPQQQASGQDGQSSGSSRRPDFPFVADSSTSGSLRGVLPLRGDGRGLVDLFA